MPDRPQDEPQALPPEVTQVNAAGPTEFGASLLGRLAALADDLETAHGTDAATARTTAPPASSEPPPGTHPERYRLGLELGRGGMGIVFTCRDADLGRDVAMKILHSDVASLPGMAQRFVDEARIGGRLQHPGIAPVHEVGLDPSNQPYFTMKLVQGETFADMLTAREDPTQDRQRCLRVFEQVCQTMAYAHAQGVLHRDLKPANIMVGAFGEVHVMDWGMAHTEAEASPERVAAEAGTTIGTPAYMPPEQAIGELDAIGTQSDVFALGGILAQLLTGAPTYTGTRREVMVQAAAGDLLEVSDRLDAVEGVPDLVQLCRRCLSADPAGRPTDAGELAREIGDHLAGVEERAHEAELDAATALGRAAEERRARWLTVALASTILVASVAGVLGYTWLQSRHRAQANLVATEAMATANRLWGEAQAAGRAGTQKWEAATVAVTQAVELTEAAVDPELRAQIVELAEGIVSEAKQVERDHGMLTRLESLRLEHAGRFDFQEQEPPYAEAFQAYGIDPETGSEEEVARLLQKSSIALDLVLALDSWATARRRAQKATAVAWERFLRIANLADLEAERRELRVAILERGRAQLLRLAEREDLRERSAWYVDNLALILQEADENDAAIQVLQTGLLTHPDSLWLHHDLGMVLSFADPPRSEEASRHMQAALALDGGSARMWLSLGTQLLGAGQATAAVRCYRRSLELREDSPKTWNNLGIALARSDPMTAAEAYARAIELDPDRADAHFNLAALFSRTGDDEQALESLRRALERDPDNGECHQLLGETLARLGRADEARTALERAITLDPDDPLAHARFGAWLTRSGHHAEAIPVLRRAIELRPDDWRSWTYLADSLDETAEHDESESVYREALRLQPDRASTHYNLGLMLLRLGRPAEAIGPLLMCNSMTARDPTWKRRSQIWIDQCLQLIRNEARLDDVVAGNATPRDGADAARLAEAAFSSGRHRLAVDLFIDAFAADPSLLTDLRQGFRADAARAAILAAAESDALQGAGLREQALEWCASELAILQRVAPPQDLEKILASWLSSPRFATVRDSASLDLLESVERERWQDFWTAVRATLQEAQRGNR